VLYDLGTWLREQRQARGWGMTQMARRLQQAGKANNDTHIPSVSVLATYIRRWEKGTISPTERYRLHYCKALGILPTEFGPQAPPQGRSEDRPASPDFDSVPAAPGRLVR
jgi:transcriptional regulator with XRE-family HTH domain